MNVFLIQLLMRRKYWTRKMVQRVKLQDDIVAIENIRLEVRNILDVEDKVVMRLLYHAPREGFELVNPMRPTKQT